MHQSKVKTNRHVTKKQKQIDATNTADPKANTFPLSHRGQLEAMIEDMKRS